MQIKTKPRRWVLSPPSLLQIDLASVDLQKHELQLVGSYLESSATGSVPLPAVFIHGKRLALPAPKEGGIMAVDLGPLIFPANTAKLGVSLVVPQPPVSVRVVFEGRSTIMAVDPGLNGGIFKSKALAELGLEGQLSSYYMDLAGEAFAGREVRHKSPICTLACIGASDFMCTPVGRQPKQPPGPCIHVPTWASRLTCSTQSFPTQVLTRALTPLCRLSRCIEPSVKTARFILN
jgi:hypothetical protein